jgi:stress response protein YsnF
VEEVLVVEKRWMLREEIHIRTERRETHQPQRITLRSEEVQIARVPHADDV